MFVSFRVDEALDNIVSVDDGESGCDVDYVHRNAFQVKSALMLCTARRKCVLVSEWCVQGDKACVSEDEWAVVQKENAESHLNLRNYAFFNGADTVGT